MQGSFLRNVVSKPGSFIKVSQQDPYFTAIGEDGDGKRFVQLELVCEADGVASPL